MAYDGCIHARASNPAQGSAQPSCLHCPTASLCMIGGLAREDVGQWNALVQSHLSLAVAGQALFELGDAMTAIYVVRAGCVKSLTVDDQGNERVRGFHLRGDVIGLDALYAGHYPCTALALEPSQLCRIPRAQALQKLAQSPLLMQRLLQRLSAGLAAALTLSGDYTADQRVAAFLLEMQQRLNQLPGAPLKLPMTRRDIANYLRLATETVCRVLTRFAAQGYIGVGEHKISVLKLASLQRLAASGKAERL